MINILKEGTIPTYIKTCRHCKTRWSFQPMDLVDNKAICPKCKHPSGMQGTVKHTTKTDCKLPWD